MSPPGALSRSLAASLLAAAAARALPNPNLPLDRPYTLRLGQPLILEREQSRMISGGQWMSFIFPRPCASEIDSSRVCGEPHGVTYRDDARARLLSVSPRAGYEFRRVGEDGHAIEAGLLATGGSGPVSFHLDARMFTELHEHWDHPSFDRELVDRQSEEASGSLAYSSFSRYRALLAYDLPWGRFAAGRDAAHWGPGLFGNLSLNRVAIPFDQATFTTHLGPLTVITLYGRLAIDDMRQGTTREDTRSLYAHRYEWRVARDVVLGVSEQLVIHDDEDPFAFLPVVPLFILKGIGNDPKNNGNIAADVAWRVGGMALLYSEFFIDDLQSPTSLFDDYWGNRWAWLVGAHAVREIAQGTAGIAAEYSRVEPWVYAHYRAETAQTTHGGHPLGNSLGPNSQGFTLMPYLRGRQGWTAWARAEWTWKGTDPGSSPADTGMDDDSRKIFLRGVESPDFAISPALAWARGRLSAEAGWTFGSVRRLRLRAAWSY